MNRSIVALLISILPFAARAQEDPRTFDRVLLPVALGIERAGASGARWASELWVRNDGDSPALVRDTSQICFLSPCFFPPPPPIPPHTTIKFVANAYNPGNFPNPALLLYVSKGVAENLLFSLRVADLSRRTLEDGTMIPVVREAELSTKAITIFDVPIKSATRVLLRAYDVNFQLGHTARVEVFDLATDAQVLDRTLPFQNALPFVGGDP